MKDDYTLGVVLQEPSTTTRNSKLLTYDITIPAKLREQVRWMNYPNKVVLGVIVTNLASGLRTKTKIVYSRNTGKRAVGTKRHITTRQIISCVDYLVAEGYVENIIGKASSHTDYRVPSMLVPTEKFMQKFMTDEEIELHYLQACKNIILRNKEKEEQEYEDTEEVQEMSATVLALNELINRHIILDKYGSPLSNVYSRIFNESFDYGGRFYRADILILHSKEGQERLDVTIDGKPVVEVDFQNLHFRIAALMEGVDLSNVPSDMYACILDDTSNRVDRGIVKVAINILFNCKSWETAKQAIQGEINSLSIENKAKYTLGNAKSVIALVETNYPAFMYLFCNEDSFGRVLQNRDSHLANDILKVFIQKEIPILCVHDSFVVAREHVNLLCKTMGEKFKERFDTNVPVPLCVSWRADSGSVVEDKIVV